MSNLASNVSILITTTVGVVGMDNSDFSPTGYFVFFAVIICMAIVVSFAVEALQARYERNLRDPGHIKKGKENGLGLGNRNV